MRSDWRLLAALARGWRLPAVVIIYASTIAMLALTPAELKLPQVFALVPVLAPTTTVTALVISLAALTSAAEPAPQMLSSAPRRVGLVNVLRAWLVALLGCVILLVSNPGAAAALLAVIALTGEGLLSASVAGFANFWVIPVAHVAAAITLGAVSRDEIALWAWFLRDDQSLLSAAVSVVIGLLGSAVWFRRLSR